MPGVDREFPPGSLHDQAWQGVLGRTIPVTDIEGPVTSTITAAGGMHPRGGPTENTTEAPAAIGRTNAQLSGAGTATIITLASAIMGVIERESGIGGAHSFLGVRSTTQCSSAKRRNVPFEPSVAAAPAELTQRGQMWAGRLPVTGP
jgi:hypothetical protein